jgi:hypothetical protein
MYFRYGIKNSTLEEQNTSDTGMNGEETHNIELTVTGSQQVPPRSNTTTTNQQLPAYTATDPYYRPPATTGVVDDPAFPTWDD